MTSRCFWCVTESRADSFNFPQFTNGITTNEGNPAQNDDNIDSGLRLMESNNWQKSAHSLSVAQTTYQSDNPRQIQVTGTIGF